MAAALFGGGELLMDVTPASWSNELMPFAPLNVPETGAYAVFVPWSNRSAREVVLATEVYAYPAAVVVSLIP